MIWPEVPEAKSSASTPPPGSPTAGPVAAAWVAGRAWSVRPPPERQVPDRPLRAGAQPRARAARPRMRSAAAPCARRSRLRSAARSAAGRSLPTRRSLRRAVRPSSYAAREQRAATVASPALRRWCKPGRRQVAHAPAGRRVAPQPVLLVATAGQALVERAGVMQGAPADRHVRAPHEPRVAVADRRGPAL